MDYQPKYSLKEIIAKLKWDDIIHVHVNNKELLFDNSIPIVSLGQLDVLLQEYYQTSLENALTDSPTFLGDTKFRINFDEWFMIGTQKDSLPQGNKFQEDGLPEALYAMRQIGVPVLNRFCGRFLGDKKYELTLCVGSITLYEFFMIIDFFLVD